MANSVSGQDEPNHLLWLAARASYLACSGLPAVSSTYNKSFIDQACSVKMAGYWPCSFFSSLCTSTPSRWINTQKNNLASIQPFWPHTWSISYTYSHINLSRAIEVGCSCIFDGITCSLSWLLYCLWVWHGTNLKFYGWMFKYVEIKYWVLFFSFLNRLENVLVF